MAARPAGDPVARRAHRAPDPTAADLVALLRPLVEADGLDLEDVEVRMAGRRRVVRALVDADGGVPLDRIAEVNRIVDTALEDSDLLGDAPYTLEVSSRGVDRPLTEPKHWRRNTGRLVAITPRGGAQWTGRIGAAGEDGVDVEADGQVRRVAYADVARAVVQVEFRSVDDDPGPERTEG